MLVKLDHVLKDRDENKKYLKPPPTLPETNIVPENRPKPKRKLVFQHIPTTNFQVRTASFREGSRYEL